MLYIGEYRFCKSTVKCCSGYVNVKRTVYWMKCVFPSIEELVLLRLHLTRTSSSGLHPEHYCSRFNTVTMNTQPTGCELLLCYHTDSYRVKNRSGNAFFCALFWTLIYSGSVELLFRLNRTKLQSLIKPDVDRCDWSKYFS